MSTSFESDQQRELLILDTGPIRELVSFHAVAQFKWERLRSDVRILKDVDSYKRCGQFIAAFRRKTTSASVVAELNYWIRNTDREGPGRLWSRVYEEFREMGMDEEVVRLLQMSIDLVARFGPVDVSLIELARLHAKHRPVVLTMDADLYGECARAGIPVTHIQEVAHMRR